MGRSIHTLCSCAPTGQVARSTGFDEESECATEKNDVWFSRRVCGYCGKRAVFLILATIATRTLRENHTSFFTVC